MSKNQIRTAIQKAYRRGGLSLREIGEKANVNYQHLGRYIAGRPLNGRGVPDMPTEKAHRVMQALGVSIGE